jgi:hypothetical protein
VVCKARSSSGTWWTSWCHQAPVSGLAHFLRSSRPAGLRPGGLDTEYGAELNEEIQGCDRCDDVFDIVRDERDFMDASNAATALYQ